MAEPAALTLNQSLDIALLSGVVGGIVGGMATFLASLIGRKATLDAVEKSNATAIRIAEKNNENAIKIADKNNQHSFDTLTVTARQNRDIEITRSKLAAVEKIGTDFLQLANDIFQDVFHGIEKAKALKVQDVGEIRRLEKKATSDIIEDFSRQLSDVHARSRFFDLDLDAEFLDYRNKWMSAVLLSASSSELEKAQTESLSMSAAGFIISKKISDAYKNVGC